MYIIENICFKIYILYLFVKKVGSIFTKNKVAQNNVVHMTVLFISEQLFSSTSKVLYTRAYFCKPSIAPCFFLLLLNLVQNSHG